MDEIEQQVHLLKQYSSLFSLLYLVNTKLMSTMHSSSIVLAFKMKYVGKPSMSIQVEHRCLRKSLSQK